MPNPAPDMNIAYIQDGEHYFQVLNEDQTDWDEAATRADYEAWKLTQP